MGDAEDYFSCPACDTTFVTKRSLTIHMIFHDKDKKFPCTKCNQVFYKEKTLQSHVIKDHGPKEEEVVKQEIKVEAESHPCEICGKQLSDKDLLIEHYKSSHPDLVQLEDEDEGEDFEQEKVLPNEVTVIKEEHSRKRKHSSDEETPCKVKTPMIPNPKVLESDEDDEFEDGDDDDDDIGFNSQFNTAPTQDKSALDESGARNSHLDSLAQHISSKIPTFPIGLGFHCLQPENITNHLNGNRTVKKLQCPDCSASFANTFNLERHKESHRANRPHKCQLCPDNRGFLRKEHLTKHMSSVHSGMKFTCEFCGKDISRKDHLVRHIRNVHTAELMGISTPQTTMAMTINTGENTASTIIGSTSISLSDDISITAVPTVTYPAVQFQNHQNQPIVQKPSHQPSNNRNSQTTRASPPNTLSLSDKALLSLQPKPKKPYVTCDMCTGLQFVDINELYEHQRLIHSDVRKFLCDYCPKSFKRREHLNKHFVLHTGEKNFRCNTCHKDFPRKDALMDHIRRIHAGINGNEISPQVAMQQLLQSQGQFKCDLCEKSFLQKHSLVRHMKTVHSVPSQYINGAIIGGAAGNYVDMEYGFYGDGFQDEPSFKNNNGLTKHPSPPPLVSITPKPKSIFPCPHCAATFNDENRFSLHLNIHKVT